ncbi:hypothetical protein [Pseudomonas gingeri]|uniref:hypothetical protein n=1 Tax=Pseudomonas gingeri TaxID=117681 RepID=UPI0015A2F2E4|nr:hypothetical protein [Pseudomonas gingeri]NWA05930.1 hypothetical protein [Pseudomonas gingeri]
MTRRYCVFLMACMALASVFAAQSALSPSDRAQLMSVYQEAVINNSEIKAARAGFEAQQEAIPDLQQQDPPAQRPGHRIRPGVFSVSGYVGDGRSENG